MKSESRKRVAAFFLEKRMKAGIDQKTLATKLGYSHPQCVSNWERGVASIPLTRFKQSMKFLNVPKGQWKRVVLKEIERMLDE